MTEQFGRFTTRAHRIAQHMHRRGWGDRAKKCMELYNKWANAWVEETFDERINREALIDYLDLCEVMLQSIPPKPYEKATRIE